MMRGGHGFFMGQPEKPKGSKRHIGRRIVRLFRPYRVQVGVVSFFILIGSVLGVVNPYLIKVIFDTALFCGNGCPKLNTLYWLVGLMILIPIISAGIGVVQTYLTNSIGQRVMEDLRNVLYEHLQGMSMRFFTSTRTGEIQSRLTNDVGGIQTVVTDTASSIFSNVVILVSTIIAMVVMSWQLTVLSLCMVPVFLVLTARAGKARRLITLEQQKSKAEMSAITQETLSVSGILLSKVFGRQEDEIDRFRTENRRLADLAVRTQMVGRTLFAVVNIFFSSAPALVYLVSGLVIAGAVQSGVVPSITPGTIVAFTTLQSRLFFPVAQMLQVSVEIQASLALFERIFEYLDLDHDIVDKPDAVVIPAAERQGRVELDHVYFGYEGADAERSAAQRLEVHADQEAPRAWAINDVSLSVSPGQLAAIVGPSGAGKTTISYLIPRLYDVTRGAVRIDGHDVRDLRLNSIADIVSMVTQETYLFHASVRKNLLYAKPDATEEELVAATKAAFIHDRIVEFDDGYETVVGERGYRMSGGEKQRLAIARVILKAPRILILDEATSALDTTSERLVQAALEPLMRGRTTIAIAHRLSTILAADVIFVLDRGRLVESGSHAELLRSGGIYATLYEQQFQSGRVQAHCEDGMLLASGEVVPEERTA